MSAAVVAALAVGGAAGAVLLNPSGSPSVAPASPGSWPAPTASGPSIALPAAEYRQPGPPAGSPLRPVEPLAVTVSADPAGTRLNKGLVGLSLELTDLALPSLSAGNTSLVGVLKSLNGPMLRFGGNSVERRAFWTSSDESLPSRVHGDATHPVARIVPDDLRRLKTLLDATGSTAAIVVDLAHLEPERAADFVKHARDILGDRFLGYTPGNEPNGYESNGMRPAGWGEAGYVKDAQAYAAAVAKAAPGVPVIGPGTYSMAWGKTFAAADFPEPRVYAFHHYPFSSCNGSDPGGKPTFANLMNREARDGGIGFRQRMMDAAVKNGLPVWIPEAGTSACPGYQNETNKSHASALWSVDYALSSAQLGVERIGFHSSLAACTGGPSMSSVCNTGTMAAPSGEFQTRANFWGEAFTAQLPAGDYLKLDASGDRLSYAYAIRSSADELSVVVINTNDPRTAAQTPVTLKLPFSAARGTMAQLQGPSYEGTDATVIDGRKAVAVPEPERPGIPGYRGGDTVTLPLTAGTATVLTFRR
ncbi:MULTISPECIES: hypothetical protein [Arthrobacter]|uniref:Glycosyl hydrolase family 79, N-terminal domain n=2 Tax=Arthrobacter TaxID=1663 RepID=A0ABU9KFH6_9MICC|nr:hypothetical protein [Arthrobacter sp. YJM1]MDP5225563.1 hypothetical protein [Arthrobacter sp. YJM1]